MSVPMIRVLSTLLLTCSLLPGCGHGVRTVRGAEADSVDFTGRDQRQIAVRMAESLSKSALLAEGQRPVMVLAPKLRNDTDEHIDTRAVIERLRTQLIKRGRARFIDDAALDRALAQLSLQAGDLFDDETATELGRMVSARYLIRGKVSNIRRRAGRAERNDFLLTLTCVDLETLVIEWTDEYEFERSEQRALLR